MSEEKQTTTFEDKCNILGELWIDYRDEADLEDFISFNDLGLPLAFAIAEALVKPGAKAVEMVNESFDLLLASLEIDDAGFTNFEDLMLG
jgi:hypothetical protein